MKEALVEYFLALIIVLFIVWLSWKAFCYCFRVLVRIARDEWTKSNEEFEKNNKK